MMANTLLVYLFCLSSFVCVSSNPITDSVIVPCKKNDEVCIFKSANIAYPFIVAGIPELNMEPMDRIDPGNLEGELPNVFYKLEHNTISGFSKCELTNFTINSDITKLIFGLTCPSLVLEGKFEVSGDIIEGKGPYRIVFGKYRFDVKADIEKVTSGNGEKHMNIKTYEVAERKLAPVKFDIKRFEGNPTSKEELELQSKKFQNIAQLIKHAYVLATFSVMFGNVNKLLQSIPYDDLFIN